MASLVYSTVKNILWCLSCWADGYVAWPKCGPKSASVSLLLSEGQHFMFFLSLRKGYDVAWLVYNTIEHMLWFFIVSDWLLCLTSMQSKYASMFWSLADWGNSCFACI